MSETETLTAAADRLEKLLTDVTAGPWAVERDSEAMYTYVRSTTPMQYEYQRDVTEIHAVDEVWPDFEYIAAMNPVVGRALVAWLRAEANLNTGLAAANTAVEESTGVRWRIRLEGSTFAESLALAHAILGEDR